MSSTWTRAAFPWLLPILLCLALFYKGLTAWFVQDDFTSLLLAMRTPDVSSALRYLTQPLAQGVVRPLPDVFFYIAFYKLAGLNALPFHAAVFLIQFANLLLLTAIVRKLSGSLWAGTGAALLWTMNAGLVVGMVWVSAFSQILCCFFLLSGFLLFLKHLETGRWTYFLTQCVAFACGLLTLEIAVVYPVLLLAYALIYDLRALWRTLPLVAATGVYSLIRIQMVPPGAIGPYAMHLDQSLLGGLRYYWMLALGAEWTGRNLGWGRAAIWTTAGVLTAALVWAYLRADARKRAQATFGIAWFVLTLAPVLPLRDQRMHYYLTAPTIGLGIAAAALLMSVPRWAATAWVAVYALCSIPFIPAGAEYWVGRSHSARRLLEGAQAARAEHPDRVLLMDGIGDELFYSAVYDQGFAVAGVDKIYLLPQPTVFDRPGFRRVETYQMREDLAKWLAGAGQAEVYGVSPEGQVTSISAKYRAKLPSDPALPSSVDAGLAFVTPLLGQGWYEPAQGIRWMARRADVFLGGSGTRLRLRPIYPERDGESVHLRISVNDQRVGEAEVRKTTELEFEAPAPLSEAGRWKVTIQSDRTFQVPPDTRDLSVAFGVIERIPNPQ